MVRSILTTAERERGRSMVEVSEVSGVAVETLRKIETGRIATPAFFTVAALARTLDLDLADLAAEPVRPPAGALSA